MVMDSSVKRAVGAGRHTHMEAMVEGAEPSDEHDENQDQLAEISQSPGVIPVESPTVPKADVTSNISGRKAVCGSKMHRRKVPAHTTSRERKAMRYAFEIPSAGIVRRKAPNGFFVMRLLTDWIRDEKGACLDTAAGGTRGGADEHEKDQGKQACI